MTIYSMKDASWIFIVVGLMLIIISFADFFDINEQTSIISGTLLIVCGALIDTIRVSTIHIINKLEKLK